MLDGDVIEASLSAVPDNTLVSTLYTVPACQFGEHGGLVPEAGADFEDGVVGSEFEEIRHHRTMNGCEIVFSNPIGTGMSS